MLDLIIVLAVWRVTSLFSQEGGPFKIFQKIRDIVKFDCFWCWSVWIAFFFSVWIYKEKIDLIILMTLAYSTGAILIQEIIMKLKS